MDKDGASSACKSAKSKVKGVEVVYGSFSAPGYLGLSFLPAAVESALKVPIGQDNWVFKDLKMGNSTSHPNFSGSK